MIFHDDLQVGQIIAYGHHTVTREEMLDFAGKYDVQPFHLSDEEAAKTHFGRLAASGLLTASIAMGVTTRYFVENGFQGQGSPGFDELLWLHPVYAGDQLTVEGEILESRTSRSKPDIGIVKHETVVKNQDGTAVLRFSGPIFVQRRPQPV